MKSVDDNSARSPQSNLATAAQSKAGSQGTAIAAPRYGLSFADHGISAGTLSGEITQLQVRHEEELPVQGKFAAPTQRTGEAPVQRLAESPRKKNNTGLPDALKAGVESLSGLSMDHVRVHRNSPKPAQLQAHAYAQGSEIHLAPGQEQHLPHEAWHVVQQAQGRVRPTMQMKGGVPVNDDAGLEREADVMGAESAKPAMINRYGKQKRAPDGIGTANTSPRDFAEVIQCYALNQVDYSTSPWSLPARTARGAIADFTLINYATFWANGTPATCGSARYHSEKECWLAVAGANAGLQHIQIASWQDGDFGGRHTADQVRAMGYGSIPSVYTERQPCGACAPLLNEILPRDANVYYSVPYPSVETSKFSHWEMDPDQFGLNALLSMKGGQSYSDQTKSSQEIGRKMGNKQLKDEVKEG